MKRDRDVVLAEIMIAVVLVMLALWLVAREVRTVAPNRALQTATPDTVRRTIP
jgi:hypothetical protein